ncbi:triose-phosphate isomerase [Candidatus Acidulodesulfobacterium sp. H_13]|uniref:triose-phosphate isomerase n=1 Tax=Candidatus Acidulodesulfobacterium sp. H_13 TaxID=3395470 RepID=UPI003AF49159
MKKKIIAANFKMNKTNRDIEEYFNTFVNNMNEFKGKGLFENIGLNSEAVFATPCTSLCESYKIIKPYGDFIKLSAQDIYFEKNGAYTGEISIDMIKDCGCEYAIVGHSERRRIFNETDETIAKKMSAVYSSEGVTPILCVGENKEVREKDMQYDFVKKQLKTDLEPLKAKSGKVYSLIIAYEPVWAIGTDLPIRPEDGDKMHRFIYDYVRSNYEVDELRIIYGGSVKESNIKELMDEPYINGVLVGGASLDPSVFLNIVRLSNA